MLLSSMDHLNYYAMPKESYLQLDGNNHDNNGGYDSHHHHLMLDDPQQQQQHQQNQMYLLHDDNSPKNGTKSSLYKTELCKRFSEFGNCRYGAKCQFAHGLGELRHVVRHPKYKTTKCKSYWGSGHCPYGSRCRFIHEEVEGYATPQFSPQASGADGSMRSMFSGSDSIGSGLHHGLGGSSNDLSGLAAASNYLYNSSHAPPATAGATGGFGSDYSLLASPFDQSTWSPAPAAPVPVPQHASFAPPPQQQHPQLHHHHSFSSSAALGGGLPLGSPTHQHALQHARPLHQRQSMHQHAAPQYHAHQQQQQHATMHRRHSSSGGLGLSTAASASTAAQANSYPDLQDAIDALMKFSLAHDDDDDVVVVAAATDNTTASTAGGSAAVNTQAPAGEAAAVPDALASAATTANNSTTANKAASAVSLATDELWKDFPVASSTQTDASRDKTPSWSAAGLVLNLDAAKAFDDSNSGGSGGEHSPRLSVFERFH